jgi:hypothetical protein
VVAAHHSHDTVAVPLPSTNGQRPDGVASPAAGVLVADAPPSDRDPTP